MHTIYTKAFLLHLIKAWEDYNKKDEEIGKHKLSEVEHQIWNRQNEKLDKSKR